MSNKFRLLIFIGTIFIFCVGLLAFHLAGAAVCRQHDVYDWAWSENIGWVSFSCENTGATNDYGVDIDVVGNTGTFKGYAWSENIGWLSFEAIDVNVAACPDAPASCQATVDMTTGEVSGWARVLSTGGWIHLRDAPSGYGVSIDTVAKEFLGWAWSEDFGWLSFNWADGGGVTPYKVMTSIDFAGPAPPNKPTNLDVVLGERAYCKSYSGYCGKVIPTFSWDFDPGQTGYEIWLDEDDWAVGSPEFTRQVDSGSSEFVLDPVFGYDVLFNHIYYWKVKTKNNGVYSEWSNIDSFATDPHAWPCPDFAPDPLNPSVDKVVDFIQDTSPNESLCYAYGFEDFCQEGSDPLGIYTYQWDLGNGETPTTKGNVSTVYNPSGTYTIRLEITDSTFFSGGICSREYDLGVGLPFPKWKEIKPE